MKKIEESLVENTFGKQFCVVLQYLFESKLLIVVSFGVWIPQCILFVYGTHKIFKFQNFKKLLHVVRRLYSEKGTYKVKYF